jgi:hydroxymethylbilane synthase
VLTIGSRGSELAMWQARHVAAQLENAGVATRIERIKTTGDHLQTASLVQAGGKGLFTKEIEEALLSGAIDLAVHSLKDLPTENTPGLAIAAIPERGDPRDAILGCKLSDLPSGARVGTSSGRRSAQLRSLRPDLDVQPVRGNIDTRIRKLKDGQYDAIVLAAAGLERLAFGAEIEEIFDPAQICPAPGQGALAIQTRANDSAFEICAQLDHAASRKAVTCERGILAALGGGCQLPVGAFAEDIERCLRVMAVVLSPDGASQLRASATGRDAGRIVAEDLLARGAASMLAKAQ